MTAKNNCNMRVTHSAPAIDTIDYVAADGAGNSATSTRTVIISLAARLSRRRLQQRNDLANCRV
jgi:hypothetical protein